MLITRLSPVTGKVNTLEIPVTPKQMFDWEDGMLIQKAMPNLTPDEREFIRIGIMSEEFEQIHLPYNEH